VTKQRASGISLNVPMKPQIERPNAAVAMSSDLEQTKLAA